MVITQSKLTAQGQISVPADIRQKLGIGPGSIIEWRQEGDQILVRRAGQWSSEDIHRAVFHGSKPASKTLAEIKEGIRKHIQKRYASR